MPNSRSTAACWLSPVLARNAASAAGPSELSRVTYSPRDDDIVVRGVGDSRQHRASVCPFEMLSYEKPPPTPGSRHAALRVALRQAAEEEATFERQRLLHGPTTADERTLQMAARHARQVAAQRVRAADGPEGQLVHAVSDNSVRLSLIHI